jgi:hypothetical protein
MASGLPATLAAGRSPNESLESLGAVWGIRRRYLTTSIVECECGADYERTTSKVIFRDKDDAQCTCGRTLESWNGSRIPQFRKIRDAPDGPQTS